MKVLFEMGQRVRLKARVDSARFSSRAGTLGEVVGRTYGPEKIDYSVSVPGGVITISYKDRWVLELIMEEEDGC